MPYSSTFHVTSQHAHLYMPTRYKAYYYLYFEQTQASVHTWAACVLAAYSPKDPEAWRGVCGDKAPYHASLSLAVWFVLCMSGHSIFITLIYVPAVWESLKAWYRVANLAAEGSRQREVSARRLNGKSGRKGPAGATGLSGGASGGSADHRGSFLHHTVRAFASMMRRQGTVRVQDRPMNTHPNTTPTPVGSAPRVPRSIFLHRMSNFFLGGSTASGKNTSQRPATRQGRSGGGGGGGGEPSPASATRPAEAADAPNGSVSTGQGNNRSVR